MNFRSNIIARLAKLEAEQLRKLLLSTYAENSFLRESLDALPLAILAINADKQILFMNRQAARYAKKESLHRRKKISDLIHHDELKKTLLAMLLELEEKKVSRVYRDMALFEKIRHELEIAVIELSKPDKPPNKPDKEKSGRPAPALQDEQTILTETAKYIIIIGDFSLWKSRYLQQSEQDSIESLHILTAGIAHEIRNPLSALDLHIQLMRRLLKKSQFHEKQEFGDLLAVLESEIRRLDSIVTDFLQSFHPRRAIKKPANLNDIVRSALDVIGPRLKEKKIALRLSLTSLRPFPFDEDLMMQLLLNALKNSMEAILESDQQSGEIRISTHESEAKLTLKIKDNGIGISLDELSKVVKPFYTSKKMGTGLGLSIISRITTAHNGELTVNPLQAPHETGLELIIDFYRINPYLRLPFSKASKPPPANISSDENLYSKTPPQ